MLRSHHFQAIWDQIYKSHLWIPRSLLPLKFSVKGIIYLLIAIRQKDDYGVLWVKYSINLDKGYPGHILLINIFPPKIICFACKINFSYKSRNSQMDTLENKAASNAYYPVSVF